MIRPSWKKQFKQITWTSGIVLLAFVLAMAGQRQLQQKEPEILVGLGSILAAMWVLSLLRVPDTAAPSTSVGQRLSSALIGISLVCSGVLLYLHTQPPVHHAALLLSLWLTSNAVFIAGVWLLDRQHADTGATGLSWTRLDTFVLLTAFGLALFLRASENGRIPLTMSGDEGNMAMEAVRVRTGQISDPFTTGWLSHPTLWFYLQALSISIFGETIAGIRMLSALIGSLTAPVLYVFTRLLFQQRRIALVATVFLLGYHLHIHFSRFALNNIADPLFGMLTLSAWLLAYRTRRYVWYALTGIGAGLAMYFYPGARLFVIVVAVLWIFIALTRIRQWPALRLKHTWRPYAIAFVGLVIAGGPLFQSFARNPNEFMARVNQQRWTHADIQLAEQASGRGTLGVVYEQLKRSYLAFNSYPDVSTFYDETRPLLWGLASVLMIVGLVLSVLRARRIEYTMLLVWFVLGVFFGSVILRGPPHSPRYVTFAPIISIWIALALEWIAKAIEDQSTFKRRELITSIGIACVTLYISVVSINGYFRDYIHRENIGGANTHLAMALANYLQEQPAGTHVWFMVPHRMYYHGFAMLDYLARDVTAVDVLDPVTTVKQVPQANPNAPTVYAVAPERLGELEFVRQVYPDGEYQELTWPLANGTLVHVYRVNPQVP